MEFACEEHRQKFVEGYIESLEKWEGDNRMYLNEWNEEDEGLREVVNGLLHA